MKKTRKPRAPTFDQAAALKRIAQTGRLLLTHSPFGDQYTDGIDAIIDPRIARALIRNGWLIPDRDSMFDLAPQSWRVRTL